MPFFRRGTEKKTRKYILKTIIKNFETNPEPAITTVKVHRSVTLVLPGNFRIGHFRYTKRPRGHKQKEMNDHDQLVSFVCVH